LLFKLKKEIFLKTIYILTKIRKLKDYFKIINEYYFYINLINSKLKKCLKPKFYKSHKNNFKL